MSLIREASMDRLNYCSYVTPERNTMVYKQVNIETTITTLVLVQLPFTRRWHVGLLSF